MSSTVQVATSYSSHRKVAVDASMSLYQFLIAVRQVRGWNNRNSFK